MMLRKRDIDALVKAAQLTQRESQYEVVHLQYKKEKSLDPTKETLRSDFFDVGYIYNIQTICCIEEGIGAPQIKIGVEAGGQRFVYESGTVANAEDSIEYVGQLLMGEHNRIFADFINCVADDTIYLNINGYRCKT